MREERDGFAEFFEAHYAGVRQYAARRFGADEADDIAQETMIRALRHYDAIDASRSAAPWLATIAHRVGIDLGRRKRPVTVESDLLDQLTPSVPDRSADVAVRVDVGGLLRDAMQRLSVRDREVLTLHEVCGLAVRDIAADAGTTPNTVRQRLFRARLNLQRQYRELGGTNYAPVPPLASPPGDRTRRPVGFLVRTAHRLYPHAPNQPSGRAAAAIFTAIAATVTMSSAPPQLPAPAAQAPTATATPTPGTLPALSRAGHASTSRVGDALALRLARRLTGTGARFTESWESGLAGWTVSGRTASPDCVPANRYDGLCSLRLDPDGTVRVSRPFDVALRSIVRATFVTRGERGTVAFELDLGTARVTVTVDPRNDRLVAGSPGADPVTVALVAQDWYQIAVQVDPAARTVEVSQQLLSIHNLTPALLTLPASPSRIASAAFVATGRPGDTAWVDQLAFAPDRPECADGVDNDRDGDVDTEDAGCVTLMDDAESPNPECSDGVDNDGDGRVDTADPSCSWAHAPSESRGCSDGIDNDGDGRADYPDDPKCISESDDFEDAACANHVDDDGDGSGDFPADLGCTGPGDDTEWSCAVLHVDSRGTSSVVPADDQQSRPLPAGICLDPLARLEAVRLVGHAATEVRGHVNLYRYAGHDFPCVVLVRDGDTTDPCTTFGATYVRRVAALVRASAETLPDPAPGTTAYLCTATVGIVARSHLSPLGRGEHALTLC